MNAPLTTEELNRRYDPMTRDELIAECERLSRAVEAGAGCLIAEQNRRMQVQHELDCAVERLKGTRQLLEDWMLADEDFDMEAWVLKVRDTLEDSNPFNGSTADVPAPREERRGDASYLAGKGGHYWTCGKCQYVNDAGLRHNRCGGCGEFLKGYADPRGGERG